MSGNSINKKVAAGMKKAGKILGWSFAVYRPEEYVSPFSDENLAFRATASWSEDDAFTKNPELSLAHFKLYMDYRGLKPGDIVHSDAVSRTFIVTEVNELRGSVAVQTPDRFDVKRVRYTPDQDIKQNNDVIYTNVPGAVRFKSQFGDSSVLNGVGSSATGHRSVAEIWTWMPVGSMDSSDTIILNGNVYTIVSLTQDHKGTVILARSAKIGK